MANNNPYENTKRFGALRSMGYSSGYDTVGREKYDYKVTFNFDYSDAELGVQKARALIAAFGKEIKSNMSTIKASNGFIFADSDFKSGSDATIKLVSDKALEKDVYEMGKMVSDESKSTMQKYIGSRVDTGRMKGSVYGRTTKRKGHVKAEAGWLDLWFKYFGYQEEGTKRISPMHSVLRTYLEVAPWVQQGVSQYIRNFVRGKGLK